MTNITVNLWLEEIEKINEQMAVLKNRKTEIEDSIKELMGDLQEFETDRYNVKWSKYIQNKFDQETFKKNNKAIYERYLVTKEQRRFSFTKKKGVKAA